MLKSENSNITQTTQSGNNIIAENVQIINGVERKIPKFLTSIPSIKLNEFVGRDNDLNKVKEQLDKEQMPLVINGMGGIGKSTFAKAFGTTYQNDYKHIVWIDAKNGIREGFVNNRTLLDNLDLSQVIDNLPRDSDYLDTAFDLLLNKVKNLQADNTTQNLLIIDDAQAKIEQYSEKLNLAPYWQVLATSRNKLQGFEEYSLDFLEEKDAIDLFLLHYKKQDKQYKDIIQEIVKMVGLHTLTIELLAKTAQANRELNLDLLQSELTQKGLSTDKAIKIKTQYDKVKVETYIMDCLEVAFDLAGLENDEEVIYLLTQFPVLPADYIPYDTLKDLLQIEAKDATPFNEKLNELRDKGWITDNEVGFKMHQVIQEVLRKKLEPDVEKCEILFVQVCCLLDYRETQINAIEKTWVLEYGEALLQKLNFKQAESEKARLQNDLALTYKVFGLYENAKNLLEIALAADIQNLGENHPNVAIRQSNLANTYRELGQYDKAKDLLELALASDLSNFGKAHPNVAISQSNLALVYQDLGQYDKARNLLELALGSDIQNFGANHPNVARYQSNLATIYQKLGQYDKARDLLELALAADIQNLGENHPNVAIRQSNLALVYIDLGQYDKARDLLELALDSDIQNFGANHPNVANRQSNLAMTYKALGKYDKARDLLELALASDMQNFGANHPNVAIRQSNLAMVYQDLGQYDKAQDLLEIALAADIQNFGANHPNVAHCQSNLATVNIYLGQYDKARDLLELALDSDIKNFGTNHPNVAHCQYNFAVIYISLKEYTQAKELFESAYQIWLKSLGENHTKTKDVKEILDDVNKLIAHQEEGK